MRGFAYVLFVGLPFCAFMCAIGLLLVFTVIGAPVGLALIALGMKKVTMSQPPRYYVNTTGGGERCRYGR